MEAALLAMDVGPSRRYISEFLMGGHQPAKAAGRNKKRGRFVAKKLARRHARIALAKDGERKRAATTGSEVFCFPDVDGATAAASSNRLTNAFRAASCCVTISGTFRREEHSGIQILSEGLHVIQWGYQN